MAKVNSASLLLGVKTLTIPESINANDQLLICFSGVP